MTPTLQEIQEHFEKAKEIRCLRLNSEVNVANVKTFSYDEKDNSWNGPAGIVMFWQKDLGFAEITKKKCGKDCAGCKPCQEKRNANKES